MHLAVPALIGWVSGFALSCGLLSVLLFKGHWRSQPFFTTWIALNFFSGVLLAFVYRAQKPALYGLIYVLLAVIDFGLQLGVILEIASKVLRRKGSWSRGARDLFGIGIALSLLTAVALALELRPAAATKADEIFARSNLFMTTLVCFMFLSLISASRRYGLAWSSRTSGVSYGILSWNLGSFLTDSLHFYLPAMVHFSGLEYVRLAVFQAATAYWMALHIKITQLGDTDNDSTTTAAFASRQESQLS